METTRNLTGLYLSGFIQEGYLPPQERKSTIPSTLYRGHVVKLARRPNSNPHRNSVGRYPMHSLNSGFSGSLIPTKDLKNFRCPDKVSEHVSHKVHGKWTNYPMSVEIRKVAGVGPPGRLLAEYVLRRSQYSDDVQNQQHQNNFGRHSSISSFQQEKDEEAFYQSMYDEIEKIVTKQENCMATNQVKLQKILLNNSPKTISPNIIASLPEAQRARTSHGCLGKSRRSVSSKRPIASAPMLKEPLQSSLLLPLPYVSSYDLVTRQPNPSNTNTTQRHFSVSPNPYQSKLEGLFIQRSDKLLYNTPRDHFPVSKKSNIGTTAAERLHGFLNASTQCIRPPTELISTSEAGSPKLASAVV